MVAYIEAAEALNNYSSCFKCRKKIGLHALRIRAYTSARAINSFHLRCFQPLEASPIIYEDIQVRRMRNSNAEKLKKWVDQWNRQFTASEETVPAAFVRKAVDTENTSERRKLLEVFAFLTLSEVELLAALTCKAWFHVSRDDTFWKAKYLSEFQPSETDAEACYRKKYIMLSLNNCWVCKQFVPLAGIRLVCPFRKRPLCITCSARGVGKLISVWDFCRVCRVQMALLKAPRFPFPVFDSSKVKMAYLREIAKAMAEHAEERRERLLQSIENQYSGALREKTLRVMKSAKLAELYRKPSRRLKGTSALLFSFLGQDDEAEDWNASVKCLVTRLCRKKNTADIPNSIAAG